MTKETTASQRALDHSSQLVGFKNWASVGIGRSLRDSIQHHARTLDQLWERCPDLVPKTKGELFAEELRQRWQFKCDGKKTVFEHAAQMIDENWGEKP